MNYHSDDAVTLDGVNYRLVRHFGSSWWMTEQAFKFVGDRVLMIARCHGEANYCRNAGLDLFLSMRNPGGGAYQVSVRYEKKSSRVDFSAPRDPVVVAAERQRIQDEISAEENRARSR